MGRIWVCFVTFVFLSFIGSNFNQEKFDAKWVEYFPANFPASMIQSAIPKHVIPLYFEPCWYRWFRVFSGYVIIRFFERDTKPISATDLAFESHFAGQQARTQVTYKTCANIKEPFIPKVGSSSSDSNEQDNHDDDEASNKILLAHPTSLYADICLWIKRCFNRWMSSWFGKPDPEAEFIIWEKEQIQQTMWPLTVFHYLWYEFHRIDDTYYQWLELLGTPRRPNPRYLPVVWSLHHADVNAIFGPIQPSQETSSGRHSSLDRDNPNDSRYNP